MTIEYGQTSTQQSRFQLLLAVLATNGLLLAVPIAALSQTGMDAGLLRKSMMIVVASHWHLFAAIGLLDVLSVLWLTRK